MELGGGGAPAGPVKAGSITDAFDHEGGSATPGSWKFPYCPPFTGSPSSERFRRFRSRPFPFLSLFPLDPLRSDSVSLPAPSSSLKSAPTCCEEGLGGCANNVGGGCIGPVIGCPPGWLGGGSSCGLIVELGIMENWLTWLGAADKGVAGENGILGSGTLVGLFLTRISLRMRILMPWSARAHESAVDSANP